MSKNVILIEDVDRFEENLEEFVYQKSKGGKIALSKTDIEKLSPDERMRAIQLLEIYQKNPETFKEKKIEVEEDTPEKEKGATLSLAENQEKWNELTEREKLSFLKTSIDMQDDLRERQDKEKIDRLPDDVKTLVSLSQSDWNELPENGQWLIIRKMDFLEEQTRRIPNVEGFDKLSEEKQEAILKTV